MTQPLRLLYIDDFEKPDPCQRILQAALKYYALPISELKLKAPIDVLYAQADADEPIGHWVSNVPRPGDVASCLKKGSSR